MSSSRLELVIDSRQAQRELNQLEGRLHGVDRAGNRADRSMQGLSGSISSVRTVAMAAGGVFAAMGISSFSRDVFDAVASSEKLRASLKTVTGSVEAASSAWDELLVFASETPFTLDQSVKGFIRMKALGLDPTTESLRSFGNTASAMGEDLMSMVEAVADATTGEFERLKAFGITASKEGEQITFTFQGVETTVRNTASAINDYLERIGNNEFGGAMAEQMETLGGEATNLEDKIYKLYLAIGDAGATDLFNAALDGSAEAVDFLTNNVENLARGVDLLSDAAIIAAGLYTGRFVAGMAAGTLSLANKTKASIADARATATATAAEIAFLKSVQGSLSAQLASSRSAVQRASLRKQLAANTVALTAANNTYTASLGRSTVAARAMGAASRGAAGAMALMGGPLGLLVGAAGLLYVFRDELNLTGQRAGLTEDQIRDLRDEMQDMSQDDLSDSLSTLNSALDTATLKAATAREELASLRADLGRGEGGLAAFREVDARHELAAASNAVADAEQRIAELNDRINVARGETASRIEENANAYVVYADRIDEAGEATRLADEFTKTLSASTEDAADKTYTLADAYGSLLDRITPNRREARQYAQDLGVLNLALASGRMNTQQYMQAMGMLQESFQDAQRDTTDIAEVTDVAADEMARAWEEASNRIDQTFSDAFAGAFDSFDSFADQLLDGFKRLLAELAYQATLKPIVVGFTGDMQGMLSGGGGGFGSTISAARGLMSGGSTAVQAGGLYGNIATNTAVSSGGLYANAATGSAIGTGAASGGFLSSAASMAGPIAAMYAAAEMGNKLFESLGAYDALGIETGGRSSQFLGQIAPIGGTIIGSALDALGIGGSPTKFSGRFGTRDSATPGTFEHQDSTSEQFYQQSAFGAVGFMDDGTKRLQRAGMGDNKEWAEQLATSTAQMDNLVASLAQGAPELDAMRSAVQGLEISSRNAGEIIEFALDERPRAAIAAMTGHFGEFVQSLEGGIESVVQQAQVAQQAHSVLASGMERLNLQFDASSAGAYDAASNIAGYAGGVENLASLQSGYYDAFFSEAERAANLQDDLTASLSQLGLELPETREGFRSLVEAQNLNTEAGAQNYATLLQLAGGFDQLRTMMGNAETATEGATEAVADYSDAIRAREGLERDLLQAQGDTQALRQLELDGLNELAGAEKYGLVSLQKRIWAIEDERAATEQAVQAQQQLMNGVQSAYQAVERAVDAERQILENAYNDTTASIERNMQTVQDAMSTTERAASGLQSTLDQMMGASASGQQAQFETASDYLRSVLSGGGLGDPDELDRALSAVANPSQDTYETLQDYQRDFLSTANVVDQLRDRADEQLTTEERSLRALERQLTQADLQFDREMSALDATLETQREQLEAQFGAQEWLSTVNDSVLSIADAIAALELEQAKAIAGGAGGSGGGSSGSSSEIDAIYQSSLGKPADAEGKAYWESTGLTGQELKDAIEYSAWAQTGSVQQFADGGIANGPMSGYPVTMHGTEAVIPLKGGSIPLNVPGIQALIREVSQLRSELAASQRAIAENTRKSARVLEREELERRQEEVV
tara:strand:+ start:9155 stop:13843 length:4689 start_codon:yes stop_codon:yes gene_type:complete